MEVFCLFYSFKEEFIMFLTDGKETKLYFVTEGKELDIDISNFDTSR